MDLSASCPLRSTEATTLVHATRETVFSAVDHLVGRLWPGMAEMVVVERPRQLLHTVNTADGDIDGWVTWELVTAGVGSWTRVRLVHDEADTADDLPPELDALLELLIESLEDPVPTDRR